MKLKLSFIIFSIFLSINILCAQTDTTKIITNDNGFKVIASLIYFNGPNLGLGYQFEPFKRFYFEAGGTVGILSYRIYLQSKYTLIRKGKMKLKLGADLSYLNSQFMQSFEISRISPLIDMDYKRWGLQFSMREPFWIDNPSYPIYIQKTIKEYYIITCITYNFDFRKKHK